MSSAVRLQTVLVTKLSTDGHCSCFLWGKNIGYGWGQRGESTWGADTSPPWSLPSGPNVKSMHRAKGADDSSETGGGGLISEPGVANWVGGWVVE